MERTTEASNWNQAYKTLAKRRQPSATHPVHPCSINGKRHYIHAADLEKRDPSYFSKLLQFTKQRGIKLLADRRVPTSSRYKYHRVDRRKAYFAIFFLTLGVHSQAHSQTLASQEQVEQESVSLKLVDPTRPENTKDNLVGGYIKKALPANTETSRLIEQTLKSHFVHQDGDPNTILSDLKAMADYYSSHAEAVDLILSLRNTNWKLKYAPHKLQTDIIGRQFKIDDVTVYFDPRSGAKLKFNRQCSTKLPFCVASPADALLHELLHVYAVLKETETFIADGGLSRHMYPITHELKTIAKENKLYKAMSQRDKLPRPIRNEHAGRHVRVSCATCVD